MIEVRIGKVAKCSQGRPGLITHIKVLPWGISYVGIGLDDGTPWSSRYPTLMSELDVAELAEVKMTKETA